MNNIIFDIGANQNVDIIELKKFNLFANIIASSYQHFFTTKISGLSKVAIDLYQHKIPLRICDYKQTDKVCVIFRTFDFTDFLKKDKSKRQREILEILQDSLIKMCEKFQLDKTPFINAKNKVIESNYKNQFLFNKLTLSKNRKHKAGIEINMTEAGAAINILFTDKNEKIITRKEVFRTQAHYYFVYQIVSSGKWLNNEQYIVSSKNKNVNFVASINSDEVRIDIQPKEKEAEIREKLNTLTVSA